MPPDDARKARRSALIFLGLSLLFLVALFSLVYVDLSDPGWLAPGWAYVGLVLLAMMSFGAAVKARIAHAKILRAQKGAG